MSAPEDDPDRQAPLWPPLLLTLGVLLGASEARHPKRVLGALATLVLLPTRWRVLTRRWARGDVIRGPASSPATCRCCSAPAPRWTGPSAASTCAWRACSRPSPTCRGRGC